MEDKLLNSQLREMRLEILEDVNDTTQDEVFKLKLKQAKYIALETLYPFDKEITELPERVANDWQIRCAIELYNTIGYEGFTAYSENGLSFAKSGNGIVSKELMEKLVPKAGVPE